MERPSDMFIVGYNMQEYSVLSMRLIECIMYCILAFPDYGLSAGEALHAFSSMRPLWLMLGGFRIYTH